MTQYILLKDTVENTSEVFETLEYLKEKFPYTNNIDLESLTKPHNNDSDEEYLLKLRLKTMSVFREHFNKKGENEIERTYYTSRRYNSELQDNLEQFALTKQQIKDTDSSLDIEHLISRGIIKPIRKISFSELELDIIHELICEQEQMTPVDKRIDLNSGKYYNKETLQKLINKLNQ